MRPPVRPCGMPRPAGRSRNPRTSSAQRPFRPSDSCRPFRPSRTRARLSSAGSLRGPAEHRVARLTQRTGAVAHARFESARPEQRPWLSWRERAWCWGDACVVRHRRFPALRRATCAPTPPPSPPGPAPCHRPIATPACHSTARQNRYGNECTCGSWRSMCASQLTPSSPHSPALTCSCSHPWADCPSWRRIGRG